MDSSGKGKQTKPLEKIGREGRSGKEEKEGRGEHEVFVLTNRLQCITEGSQGKVGPLKAGTEAQISEQCCLLACFLLQTWNISTKRCPSNSQERVCLYCLSPFPLHSLDHQTVNYCLSQPEWVFHALVHHVSKCSDRLA